jgi:RNA polymerase sigma-70 factor (ECF subfamily)
MAAPAVPFAVPFAFVEATDREVHLIERLRAGDVAALGEVYDAHHAHVRAFARRFVGDDAAAEDLVQETFLAIPKVIGRFRRESSLRTFLVSVALNNARHHVRASARRRAAMGRLAHEPEGPTSAPDGRAARRELAAALLRALDTLPLEQRAAVVLCDVEERTSAEVGVIVGVPEATVRTRLFHARRKLRELLEREGMR